MALNYIEYFLILASALTKCVSIFAFASLVVILIGIASYAVGLKIFAITVGIKKYKLIINEKRKKCEDVSQQQQWCQWYNCKRCYLSCSFCFEWLWVSSISSGK